MQSNRSLWPIWVSFLQRWGLGEFAALTLDAVGPLAALGAQFVYLGQPFLHKSASAGHLQALADLLENPVEIKKFTAFLREGKTL